MEYVIKLARIWIIRPNQEHIPDPSITYINMFWTLSFVFIQNNISV